MACPAFTNAAGEHAVLIKVTVSRQSWLTDLMDRHDGQEPEAWSRYHHHVAQEPRESVPPDRRSRVLFNDRHQDLVGPSLGEPTTGQHHDRE